MNCHIKLNVERIRMCCEKMKVMKVITLLKVGRLIILVCRFRYPRSKSDKCLKSYKTVFFMPIKTRISILIYAVEF